MLRNVVIHWFVVHELSWLSYVWKYSSTVDRLFKLPRELLISSSSLSQNRASYALTSTSMSRGVTSVFFLLPPDSRPKVILSETASLFGSNRVKCRFAVSQIFVSPKTCQVDVPMDIAEFRSTCLYLLR